MREKKNLGKSELQENGGKSNVIVGQGNRLLLYFMKRSASSYVAYFFFSFVIASIYSKHHSDNWNKNRSVKINSNGKIPKNLWIEYCIRNSSSKIDFTSCNSLIVIPSFQLNWIYDDENEVNENMLIVDFVELCWVLGEAAVERWHMSHSSHITRSIQNKKPKQWEKCLWCHLQ